MLPALAEEEAIATSMAAVVDTWLDDRSGESQSQPRAAAICDRFGAQISRRKEGKARNAALGGRP
jgi:hypothetical protein